MASRVRISEILIDKKCVDFVRRSMIMHIASGPTYEQGRFVTMSMVSATCVMIHAHMAFDALP